MRPTLLALPLVIPFAMPLACSDAAPLYPPLPDSATGADSTGATTTGATSSGGSSNTSTGGKSNTNTGGKNSTSTGGKSTTGGSGTVTGDHCEQPWSGEPPPAPTVACDLDNLTNGGELTGDITSDKTLESGKFYTLKGVTRVSPGKTLTIPPCVVIKGQDADSVLVLLSSAVGDPDNLCSFTSGKPTPAAKLVAVGEPMAPIIFTSNKPKGSRAPGDWGGVLLLGNAFNVLAKPDTRAAIEGLVRTECHGWYNRDYDADSSGSLAYVRIEYASRQAGMDAETNGLTFGSVGSGTTLHHIMVSNSNDDCFEWFGGSVSGDHLIALNCDDDMFDSDMGFSGKMQFLFGRQFPTTTERDSRGFEIDNTLVTEDPNLPRTSGSWSNFTVCGGGSADKTTIDLLRQGLAIRTTASGSLLNGFITGFTGGAITDISGDTTLTYSRVWDNASTYGNGHTGGLDWFTKQSGNSADPPVGFCDCWANPPSAVGSKPVKGTKPTGFADESADYEGAFADSSPESNWMQGLWVDWSSE